MRKNFLILLLLLLITPAHAEDCLNCEQYESFLSVGNLADEVSQIGLIDGFHTEGSAFSVIQKNRRLRQDLESMIPRECLSFLRQKSNQKKNFSTEARYFQIMQPKSVSIVGENARDYISAYQTAFGKNVERCYLDPQSVECVKSRSEFSHQLNSNISEAQQIFFNAGLNLSPVQVRILQAFDRVLNSGTESAMLQMIKKDRMGLSHEQFLTLVQMVGYRLNKDYDKVRGTAGFSSKGAVSGDSLLKAALFNTTIGYVDSHSVLYNDPEYAGICRDIAAFQGKMLHAAGFKNTYVVAFSKLNGNYHVTVVAQNPDQLKTVYKMNYDQLIVASGVDGARLLYQGGKDSSLNYRLMKPGGRSVADLPSELGKLLAETSGFDVRVIDPLARPTASVFAPGMTWGENGSSRIGVFAARDGNGAEYTGISFSKNWAENFNTSDKVRFPGKAGVSAIYTAPQLISGFSSQNAGQQLYLQVEQHAQVDLFRSSAGMGQLTSDTVLTALGSIGRYDGDDPADSYFKKTAVGQGALYVDQRLIYQQGGQSDAFQSRYIVGAQFAPGLADSRTVDQFNVFANHIYARGEVSHRSGQRAGREIAAIVVDHNLDLGSRGYVEAGYVGESCGMTAHLSGRLGSQTSLALDRSLRRAGLTLMCENSDSRLRLIGESSIEPGIEEYFLGANWTWNFQLPRSLR